MFRLQGLITLLTAYSLRALAGFSFTPAALLGFPLRSFLLSQGIRRVSARKDPHTVKPAIATAAGATGRPGRPRFLGFAPYESPWRYDAGLAR